MPEPIRFDPVKLRGPWAEGYALEKQHSLSSEFVGYDGNGNPIFEAVRSDLGELVFQLKNRNNRSAATDIAAVAAGFVTSKWAGLDMIVPVPPSRRRRTFQPTEEIASDLGRKLRVPVRADAVTKNRATPQLKDISDPEERSKLLEGAFTAKRAVVGSKRVLLLDDLYRSGATAGAVAHALTAAGAASVFMLAITKTRTAT